MNNQLSAVFEKAKKLLVLKERAATAGEAKAAAFALGKLLDKHRVSMAELEMTGNAPVESAYADQENPLMEFSKIPNWERNLVEINCKQYGVQWWRRRTPVGYTSNGKRKFTSAIFLCGRSGDMDMVRYMFAWLSTEALRISESECAGKGRRFTNSWLVGFVDGINTQLQAARAEVAQHTHSDTGIVLRRRIVDAQRALDEAIKPSFNKVYFRVKDQQAHRAGQRRGEQHHLGETLDSGAHRALPEATGD